MAKRLDACELLSAVCDWNSPDESGVTPQQRFDEMGVKSEAKTTNSTADQVALAEVRKEQQQFLLQQLQAVEKEKINHQMQLEQQKKQEKVEEGSSEVAKDATAKEESANVEQAKTGGE